MKAIFWFLAILVAAKLGYQELMYRSATGEIIATAYRERAINACQRDAKAFPLASGIAWEKTANIKVVIGKGGLDVYLWQVDSALWNARYKNPYLFLTPAAGSGPRVYCEFDIVNGSAAIYRM